MPAELSLLAAFTVGLLGGVHCVGMCGGIVTALTLGLPEGLRKQPARMLPYQLAYNLGRLSSYALAGALMGGVGVLAANLTSVNLAQRFLQGIAGVFMLSLGLYLGGWWLGLARLEQAGGILWQRLEPLGRHLLPVNGYRQAVVLGLLWGWLPCGLVYSVLIWSISTASALHGALLMLSFGLGTLPTLLTIGVVTARLSQWVHRPWVRRTSGGLVAALGVYTVWLAL